MTLDQKQKQFWNRHAKRNKNPRDPNVSVLLGAFVSRSNVYDTLRGIVNAQAPFAISNGIICGKAEGVAR